MRASAYARARGCAHATRGDAQVRAVCANSHARTHAAGAGAAGAGAAGSPVMPTASSKALTSAAASCPVIASTTSSVSVGSAAAWTCSGRGAGREPAVQLQYRGAGACGTCQHRRLDLLGAGSRAGACGTAAVPRGGSLRYMAAPPPGPARGGEQGGSLRYSCSAAGREPAVQLQYCSNWEPAVQLQYCSNWEPGRSGRSGRSGCVGCRALGWATQPAPLACLSSSIIAASTCSRPAVSTITVSYPSALALARACLEGGGGARGLGVGKLAAPRAASGRAGQGSAAQRPPRLSHLAISGGGTPCPSSKTGTPTRSPRRTSCSMAAGR